MSKPTPQANQSFEIRTSQDYLEYLVCPSLGDFQTEHTSSRAAITCAIFVWHLHDWIWAEHKAAISNRLGIKSKRDFVCYLTNDCRELSVVQEIANGSKHFKSEKKEIRSTDLTSGFYQGLLALGTASHLTVELESQTVVFLEILKTCIQYWNDFLDRYL